MSQEFRSLSQQFTASGEDELLIVGDVPQRITIKALRYDSVALLQVKHPADQNYGIGTADAWSKLPFTKANLSGSEAWLQLNADGSFTLFPGSYFLKSHLIFANTNSSRLSLRRNGNFLEVSRTYAQSSSAVRTMNIISSKFIDTNQDTYSIEVSVSNPSEGSIYVGDTFLSGIQATIASCEIYKLG